MSLFPPLCLISPSTFRPRPAALRARCPGRPGEAWGSRRSPPHCCGRPRARRRDEGQSKGSGLAAASLTAAFQRRAYQSQAFSEALISNLEPSPLWRGAFNLTSGNSAAPHFFLHLIFIVFHSPSPSLPPPNRLHCPAHPPDKAYGGGVASLITLNSLLMITSSRAERS